MIINKIISKVMSPNTKENIQYICAIISFLSGIVMCFLSFFLNKYDINASVLGYFGECLLFTSAIFGIAMYIRTKFGEVKSSLEDSIENKVEEIISKKTN